MRCFIVSQVSCALSVLILLAGGAVCCGQTVDQSGLASQYDQSVAIQNVAIDALIEWKKKSADAEYQKIISRAGDAIAAGTESLGFARVNVVAAATTADAYRLAIKENRLADAQTAASLWGKQATLARDHLKVWGTNLAAALAAMEEARRWLQ